MARHAGKSRILAGSPTWTPRTAQQTAAAKLLPSANLKANKLGDGIANALQALVAAVPEDEGIYLQQLLFMCSTVAKYQVFLHTNFPAEAQGAQATEGDPYSCTFTVFVSTLYKFVRFRQVLLNAQSLSSSLCVRTDSEPGLVGLMPCTSGSPVWQYFAIIVVLQVHLPTL